MSSPSTKRNIIGYLILITIFVLAFVVFVLYGNSNKSQVQGLAPNSEAPKLNSNRDYASATMNEGIPVLACAEDKPCAINLITGTKSCRSKRQYVPTIESCSPMNGCPSFMPNAVSSDGSALPNGCITTSCRCATNMSRGEYVNAVFNIANTDKYYTITPTSDFQDTAEQQVTIPNTLRSLVQPGCPRGKLIFYSEATPVIYGQLEFGGLYPPTSTIGVACVKTRESGRNKLYDRTQNKVVRIDYLNHTAGVRSTQDRHEVKVKLNYKDAVDLTITIDKGTNIAIALEHINDEINKHRGTQYNVLFRTIIDSNDDFHYEGRLIRAYQIQQVKLVSNFFSGIGFASDSIVLTPDYPYVRSVYH